MYFVAFAVVSLWYLLMKASRYRVLVVIAILSLVDAVVFLAAVLPSMLFGYMGSEHYAWTSLGVAIISGATGMFVLGPAFAFVGLYFYIRGSRARAFP